MAARKAPQNLRATDAQWRAETSAASVPCCCCGVWHRFRQTSHLWRSQTRWRALPIDRNDRLRSVPLARRRVLHGAPYSALCPKRRRRDGSAMRKPIIKNHKKTYGRGRKPPPKSCLVLSAETVDTAADTRAPALEPAAALQTVTTARLDKQQTIELAKETLRQICITPDAPSNAKATAARTLLELVGALGRHADPSSLDTIPASEMSLEQLDERIAALISR
jgi:hypothetical protein